MRQFEDINKQLSQIRNTTQNPFSMPGIGGEMKWTNDKSMEITIFNSEIDIMLSVLKSIRSILSVSVGEYNDEKKLIRMRLSSNTAPESIMNALTLSGMKYELYNIS